MAEGIQTIFIYYPQRRRNAGLNKPQEPLIEGGRGLRIIRERQIKMKDRKSRIFEEIEIPVCNIACKV
jgi:hypothetical protein